MANNDTTAYRFGDVLIDRPFAVCNVELKPFSLGHLILLKDVLKSPLLATEVTPVDNLETGLTQFFTAVIICSLTYEDGVKFIYDAKEQQETIEFFINHIQNVMASQKGWNYVAEVKVFEKYLQNFIQVPLFKELNKQDDFPSGSDDATATVILFKKLGVSESDILNMSFKKLQMLRASYLESEGMIRVYERRVVDHLKKQEATERENAIMAKLKGDK